MPREGYQRGWGIQYGELREKIAAEPLFQDASAQATIPSWVSPDKRLNLYLVMTRFLPKLRSRHIVEFGSYKGGNALFMGLVMRAIDPEARIYAFDTYGGMPETDRRIDAHGAGDFADTSLDDLQTQLGQLNLSTVIPVKGLFQDTFASLAAKQEFGLAYLDADIYSAIKFAQDAVWDRMAPGGYLVYDDADVSSCIGATQAVEELIMERRIHSEQIWPHFVFRAGL